MYDAFSSQKLLFFGTKNRKINAIGDEIEQKKQFKEREKILKGLSLNFEEFVQFFENLYGADSIGVV